MYVRLTCMSILCLTKGPRASELVHNIIIAMFRKPDGGLEAEKYYKVIGQSQERLRGRI